MERRIIVGLLNWLKSNKFVTLYINIFLIIFIVQPRTAPIKPTVHRPFPQHTTYKAGSIKPNIVSQAQLDQTVQQFYNEWRTRYLRQPANQPNQYYVFYNLEGGSTPANAVSVSEGHGYGMMATVFMAGYDPKAKDYFDGLYHFYKAHLSKINPALMAWQQVKDKNGSIIDNPNGGGDSATDGDLDIAYSLLLADRQWGSTGSINYLSEANKIIVAIMKSEVNQPKMILKLGDWADNTDPQYGTGTRTSDFIPDHFKAFARITQGASWSTLNDKIYNTVQFLNTHYAPSTGLLPDFAEQVQGQWKPSPPNYLESPFDGNYYWNSCRIAWRLPVDYLLSGDSRNLPQLRTLNQWIQQKTGKNPSLIRAGFYLNGKNLPEPFDNALAFVAPFAVSAMIDAGNQDWLNKLWTHINEYKIQDNDYFGNSIKLQCLLIISGNYWTP